MIYASSKNHYTKKGTAGTVQQLIQAGFSCIQLLDFCGVSLPAPTSLVLTLTEEVADFMFSSFYEDVDSITKIMAELQDKAGAGYTKTNGTDTYHATNGVCITVKGFYDKPKHPANVYQASQYYESLSYKSQYYESLSYKYERYDSTKLVG